MAICIAGTVASYWDRSELGQAYHFDEVAAVVELDKCVRRSDFWFPGVFSVFHHC